jgi:hypothetical protein
MNKRLKQLAIESKLIAPEYNGFDHTRLSLSQQRFAELIVRECVGMLDDEDDYGPYSTGVRSAAYRIKKSFGVEE